MHKADFGPVDRGAFLSGGLINRNMSYEGPNAETF